MLIAILVINTLALMAWGKYLNHLDAFTADKKNEHRLFWLVITGGIPSIVLTLTAQSKWENILYSVTGLHYDMNPFVGQLLIVGPVEEFSKFIIFIVLTGMMKSIKEPRDGILQAASVAMGFALVENIIYAFSYGYTVLIIRSFLTILGHMSYAVFWGFTWGATAYTSAGTNKTPDRFIVFPSLILAAVFHGTYNAFIDYGNPIAAIFVNLTTMSLFFVVYNYVRDNSPYRAFKLREYRKAIPELKRGLQKHPNSFVLNKRMGVFNIYARSYNKAGKYLNKARKIKPKNSAARFYYGVSKYLDGEIERGLKHMNSAVAALPVNMREKMVATINNVVRTESDRKELLNRFNKSSSRFVANRYTARARKTSARYNLPSRSEKRRASAQRRIVRVMVEREERSLKEMEVSRDTYSNPLADRSSMDKMFKGTEPVIPEPYSLNKGESVINRPNQNKKTLDQITWKEE